MRALWLLALTACRLGFDPTDGVPDGGAMTTIAITITGAGSGTVRVKTATGEIPCASTCSVPTGSTITFVAQPGDASWFRGWTNGCSGRQICQATVNAPLAVTADFTPEPNRIFMSSRAHDAALLPSDGDALCNELAAAAGLGGDYRVLLTSGSGGWGSRVPAARGFIRVDGEPVTDRIDAIDDHTMAALTLDEHGEPVGDSSFWAPHTSQCNDWGTNSAGQTGTVISTARGSNYQSGGGATTCNTQAHVICAGADRDVQLEPVPDAGRVAFTTTTQWPPSSGLAAADARCASEAMSAGLTGSFKAFLAMPGASPLSRFDLSKPTWARRDGFPLLPTAADWKTARATNGSLHVAADGTRILYSVIATGADEPSTPGTAATTCDGWTSTTGTNANPLWTWETPLRPLSGTNFCNATVHLMCFEE